MYSPPFRLGIDVWVPRNYPSIINEHTLSRTLTRNYYAPGAGYLAGSFPDGITSIEGVPGSASIRVMYRVPGFPPDGVVVAETVSSPDGTWRIDGLNPDLKYDVICRHEGYNDMILSNVSPALDAGLKIEGSGA